MTKKKILGISVSVSVIAALVMLVTGAVLAAFFVIGVKDAYGHHSVEHYIAKLPPETTDALLAPLGLSDAAIIGYTEYGGQLDGGEYYITIRCDSAADFLMEHEFVRSNFESLGAGSKHLVNANCSGDTGYYIGSDTITLLIQDRDYKNLIEQNELTRRLEDLTAAAEPLFN